MRVTIKVEGLAECEAALAELPVATSKNVLRRALTNAAQPIAAAAESRVPRLTNRLAKSIKVGTQLSKRQRGKHKRQSPVEVFVGAGPLPHAHMVEFGAAHNAPEPYLRPAVDSQGKAAIEKFKQEVKSEIDRAAARLARKAARIAAKLK